MEQGARCSTGEDNSQGFPEREPGAWVRLFQDVSQGDAKRWEAEGRGVRVDQRGDGLSMPSGENLGRRGSRSPAGDRFLLSLSRAHRPFGTGVLALLSSGRNVRRSWGEGRGEKFKWPSGPSRGPEVGVLDDPSVCVWEDKGPQGLFCGLELTDS